MNQNFYEKLTFFLLLAGFVLASNAFAQEAPETAETKQLNFRYSQNPKTRTKPVEIAANQETTTAETENGSIAEKTLEIAKKASTANLPPTEIYRVGNGDILFINLQNAPKASTYYTVLNDGTIDYPLSGEMVQVNNLTTDEIEELLRTKIKLYENPQLSVSVREYASHNVSVLGLVEKAGDKKIQREAVPLFVLRAEAIVSPKAAEAVIRRADGTVETVDLKDAAADNVLIFPNDIVEFGAGDAGGAGDSNQAASRYYYIGGDIVSGGQKDFVPGITLTQAILASGGLKKTNVKRVVIRRKNADGLLFGREYNLKNIKDGKEPDPQLAAGDTVEVDN